MKREYDFRHAKRGAVVPVPKGKTRITIRLDDEVLAWFREQVEQAGGGSYQTVINEALRQHMKKRRAIGKDAAPGDSRRDSASLLTIAS